MSNPCNIDLTDEQAECYLDRYVDLKDAFGDDLKKAKQHWKRYGCIPKEGRSYECLPAKCKSSVSDKQAICYLDRYADLKSAYGNDLEKAKRHWKYFGCSENRNVGCQQDAAPTFSGDETANIIKYYNKYNDDYEFNKNQINEEHLDIKNVEGDLESTQLGLESSRFKLMAITLGSLVALIVSMRFIK